MRITVTYKRINVNPLFVFDMNGSYYILARKSSSFETLQRVLERSPQSKFTFP